VVARRSSRRDRARPLASLHVLSALPADCPHNPAPFAPYSPIRESSLRAFACCRVSFCPHIPDTMIDLGRYSPSWGRNASKISLRARRNRIKRTFAAGKCDRQPSAPPSFGHFDPGGRGSIARLGYCDQPSRGPRKVSEARGDAEKRGLSPDFHVRALRMPDMGTFGPRAPVAPPLDQVGFLEKDLSRGC